MKKIVITFFLCFCCFALLSNDTHAQSAKQAASETLDKNHTNVPDRARARKTTPTIVDLPEIKEAACYENGKPIGKVVKMHLDESGKQIITLSKAYVAQLSETEKAKLKANPIYLIED